MYLNKLILSGKFTLKKETIFFLGGGGTWRRVEIMYGRRKMIPQVQLEAIL